MKALLPEMSSVCLYHVSALLIVESVHLSVMLLYNFYKNHKWAYNHPVSLNGSPNILVYFIVKLY